MKNILFSIAMVITTLSASADSSKVILHYEFAEQINNSSSYSKIATSLSEDGLLTIQNYGAVPNDNSVVIATSTHQLKAATLKPLLHKIHSLSQAEVVVEEPAIICMMYVAPDSHLNIDNLIIAKDYDYATHSFKGSLTLVHGPQGCWLSQKTHLSNDYSNFQAQNLKSIFKTLSVELMN